MARRPGDSGVDALPNHAALKLGKGSCDLASSLCYPQTTLTRRVTAMCKKSTTTILLALCLAGCATPAPPGVDAAQYKTDRVDCFKAVHKPPSTAETMGAVLLGPLGAVIGSQATQSSSERTAAMAACMKAKGYDLPPDTVL